MIYVRLVSKNLSPSQREGFTLVELSIVLVIIGLLIGGILVGQSLVESAKIKAQIQQLQQYDIAAQSFLNKFKRIPGDTNRNGVLEFSTNSNGHCAFPSAAWVTGGPATRECWTVFSDLSLMGGISGNFSPNIYATHTTITMFGPGRYGPVASNGISGMMAGQTANLKYLYWIINSSKKCTSGPGGWSSNGECDTKAYTPKQALSIDQKIDDGNAFTGTVAIVTGTTNAGRYITHYYPSSTYNAGVISNPDDYALNFQQGHGACINSTTGAYITSSNSDVCGLQFRSGMQK